MSLAYRLIFNRCNLQAGAVLALILCGSCTSTSDAPVYPSELLESPIDYPFAGRTEPLGRNGPDQKFIVRSAVGNTEYTIEIPGAGRDYDIMVPLADLEAAGASGPPGSKLTNSKIKPQVTDREFRAAMPEITDPDERALVEGAYGVGQTGGPSQSPSYAIHLAKINSLYKNRKYEHALIEINNLLTFYPTSAKLYKMKGTVLMKLRNYKLAELAWTRGLEMAPSDPALKQALASLRQRIARQKTTSQKIEIPEPAPPTAQLELNPENASSEQTSVNALPVQNEHSNSRLKNASQNSPNQAATSISNTPSSNTQSNNQVMNNTKQEKTKNQNQSYNQYQGYNYNQYQGNYNQQYNDSR